MQSGETTGRKNIFKLQICTPQKENTGPYYRNKYKERKNGLKKKKEKSKNPIKLRLVLVVVYAKPSPCYIRADPSPLSCSMNQKEKAYIAF